MALKFLSAGVTQGSADAYAETEFSTGLSNVTRQAYRVRRIEFYVPPVIGADSFMSIVLRRNSASAINLRVGNPMIAGIQRHAELTTSGLVVFDSFGPANVFTYAKDEDLLIVEESLFLDIDSNGTSAANEGYVRIGYEIRSITENERLGIQASTAQG